MHFTTAAILLSAVLGINAAAVDKQATADNIEWSIDGYDNFNCGIPGKNHNGRKRPVDGHFTPAPKSIQANFPPGCVLYLYPNGVNGFPQYVYDGSCVNLAYSVDPLYYGLRCP